MNLAGNTLIFAIALTYGCHFPGTVILVDDASDSSRDDAVVDATSDHMDGNRSDVVADQTVDATDVGTDAITDVPIDVPTLAAPRAIAPMSTSHVTLPTPTLHWVPAPDSSGTRVELCTTRACPTVAATFDSSQNRGAPALPLTPGVWFWRMRALCSGTPCSQYSPTWQFSVGYQPPGASPADTSYGTSTDLNGDGFTDLVVGAPQTFGGLHGTPVGKAFVYEGPALGLVTTILSPDTNIDGFATRVASAGDLDGDGYGDLLVSRSNGPGNVYVYFGAEGGLGANPTPTITLTGNTDGFGKSIAGLGDINGDGYGDFAVGAPTAGTDNGAVFVYYGSAHGPTTSHTMLAAQVQHEYFGSVVAAAGDLDGDGISELAVGAPTPGVAGGTLYVFIGRTTPVGTSSMISTHGTGAPTGFGSSIAGAGDLNGDGLADIAVGAPGAMSNSGSVSIFNGDSTFVLRNGASRIINDPSGVGGNELMGTSVATGGDVDGNGVDDLVIGVPGAPPEGAIFVAKMLPAAPFFNLVPIAPPSSPAVELVGSVVATGDYNNDGLWDVAGNDPTTVPTPANVYVFFSSAAGFPSAPSVTIRSPTQHDAFGTTISLLDRPTAQLQWLFGPTNLFYQNRLN